MRSACATSYTSLCSRCTRAAHTLCSQTLSQTGFGLDLKSRVKHVRSLGCDLPSGQTEGRAPRCSCRGDRRGTEGQAVQSGVCVGGCRREAAGRQPLSQMFELSEQVPLTDSPAGGKRGRSLQREPFSGSGNLASAPAPRGAGTGRTEREPGGRAGWSGSWRLGACRGRWDPLVPNAAARRGWGAASCGR